MSADLPPTTTPGGRTRRLRAPTPRAALAGVTAALLIVVAIQVMDVLTPFVLGLLLIYLLAPSVDRLSRVHVGRRTIPRWVAILLLYLAIVVVVAIGVVLVVRPMSDQLQRFGDELPQRLDGLRAWYAGLQLPGWLRTTIDHIVDSDATGEDGAGPDLASLLPLARSLASTLVSTFGYLIIPVWAFYVLKDLGRLSATFVQALPSAWRRDSLAVMGIVDHTFGRWIRGQLFLGLVVGLATFVGLLILGALVDPVFLTFAVLLAVIAGFLELVPIIGPILSMIPTLVLSLTAQDPVKAAIAVVVLYVVVQQVENHVLVPQIQGDAVELHPSIVILSLIVGSALFGLLGAILSVPVTAAGRDIYRYLFRRLSEDDPDVPDPDAPDLARKTGRPPRPADMTTNAPADDLPAVTGRGTDIEAATEAAAAWSIGKKNYYQVLMVDQAADADIMAVVHRRLAQRYHPDMDPGEDAKQRMLEINQAYDVLRNPERRARYDQELASRRDRRNADRYVKRPTDPGPMSTGASAMSAANVYGEAGPPPRGVARGSILDFGRYKGWSLGQVAAHDPDFLEWLERSPGGRQYRAEIAALLKR